MRYRAQRFSLRPETCLVLLMLAFALFFSLLAVQQHRTFQTNGLDLGNVDQALWNTSQGRFLEFTLMTPVSSRLALHVEPILLLFVPFYWLGLGGPELLLVVQATVVALGAWPLYQLAKLVLGGACSNHRPPMISQMAEDHSQNSPPQTSSLKVPHWLLLVFPGAYLLLPTLESAVLFDFHAVTMVSTLLLFAFWALVRRKDVWFVVFALLAMACKEDMPLVVGALGLYAGLAHRRWRLAGLIIGLSVAWFALAVLVIQPRAAGGNIQLERYAWLGDGPLAIGQAIIRRPDLVYDHLWYQADLPNYLSALFFPTAFLALFSPLTLMPMLPTLAVNLLSDNPFTWRLEDFHYGAPLAPFLFISTIYGIRRIVRWVDRSQQAESHSSRLSRPPNFWPGISLTVLLLLFTAVYHYHRGFTPLARPFDWPVVTAHHRQVKDVLTTVSPDAALFAQSNLVPHLSQRRVIYGDFGYFTNPDFPAPVPVEEILLDVTSFENIGGLHQFLRQTLLESDDYGLVEARDGILHFQTRPAPPRSPLSAARSSSPPRLPASFYSFARPTNPPDYPLTVDFGEVIRLHGFALHFDRQEEVEVSIDLEPLRHLAPDLRPVLYLLTADGQPIGGTGDLQPGLVWYPPDQWPPGQKVRVRFNTVPWYTRQTRSYRLALGMVNGEDVWAVEQRLRPGVDPTTSLKVRLPADGSLIELAQIEQVWAMPTGGPEARRFRVPHPPQPIEADFDNRVKLVGSTFPRTERQHEADTLLSEFLTVTLYWQALGPSPDLIRFVQLIGPDGKVYGQQDSAPDNGMYPTGLWQPGEVVIETVTFPVQPVRPAGRYQIHLGLYYPDTGQRLPLTSGGDHVAIDGPFSNAK